MYLQLASLLSFNVQQKVFHPEIVDFYLYSGLDNDCVRTSASLKRICLKLKLKKRLTFFHDIYECRKYILIYTIYIWSQWSQCNVDILHGSSGQSGHYKWKEIYILSGPTKKWLLSSNSKSIRNYYSQFPVLFVKLIWI